MTLLFLQAQLNNAVNIATNLSLNEIIYDFKIREVLITLFVAQVVDLSTQRLKYKQKVVDVTAFANVKTKIYYDARHTLLLLKARDYAYLRLYYDYRLLNKLDQKLFQQRCELFLIKQRVSWLIYELKLLFAWRIYSVISVAQLEPASIEPDFYSRFRSSHSSTVKVKKNNFQYRFYEIKKLVNRKIRKFDKTLVIQYLVRWFNYEVEYNE